MAILEKVVIILYSKTHVKSRCEQYHLFAAYNFLFQAALNSFVWGEGIDNILFSIHMLKLASTCSGELPRKSKAMTSTKLSG